MIYDRTGRVESFVSHGGACFTAQGWSSVAFQATAAGGARSRALDEPCAVKKMPPCEQWINNEVDLAIPAIQLNRISR
jgi:hypothetical protein